ncbi:MAG: hypothetical protein Q3W84_04145 [Eubacteriales bacterium]|nr:hypothetical protein [Eubacteriales bacterium]
MFDFLYKAPRGRHDIVKRTIEDEGEEYIKRIYALPNRFYLSFFEECINSSVADAYEYFAEIRVNGNVFGENVYAMTKEKGRRFLKLMAVHHSIKILKCKSCPLNPSDMRKMLFDAYDMCASEQKMYDLLYACAVMYSGSFSELFASAVMKYIFDKDTFGRHTIAFIENFCYNSYETMFNSFTKYMSLEQRLQGA